MDDKTWNTCSRSSGASEKKMLLMFELLLWIPMLQHVRVCRSVCDEVMIEWHAELGTKGSYIAKSVLLACDSRH